MHFMCKENDFFLSSDYFYQFGEIRLIHMVPSKCCAFIQFTARVSAEMAAERTFEQLMLKARPSVYPSYFKKLTAQFSGPKGEGALGPASSPDLCLLIEGGRIERNVVIKS